MSIIHDQLESPSQWVEVSYYFEGKFIGHTFSQTYPPYQEGHTVELQLEPSARDKVRQPAQDVKSQWFMIDFLHHQIREQLGSKVFLMKLDVWLVKMPPLIDGDDRDIVEIVKSYRRDRRKRLTENGKELTPPAEKRQLLTD